MGCKPPWGALSHRTGLDAPDARKVRSPPAELHLHRSKKADWHNSDLYCNKFVFFNFNNCFSGHDKEVDTYVTKLERRTSALPAGLKVVSNGISSVGTISAMDLPGVLIQVALAIGDHSSTKLPPRITRNIQRALYYFFALQRGRSRKLNDDRSVEVRAGARFRIVGYARFN